MIYALGWLTDPADSRGPDGVPVCHGAAQRLRYLWARGLQVDVYRNLRNGAWSVRATGRVTGPGSEGVHAAARENKGRVIGHSHSLVLVGARFIVQPGNRARAVRDRTRNIHAFVRGTLVAGSRSEGFTTAGWQVTYNPFDPEGRGFRLRAGPELDAAARVRFSRGECNVYNPTLAGAALLGHS